MVSNATVVVTERVVPETEVVPPHAPPLMLRWSWYPPIAEDGSVAAGHATRIGVVVRPIRLPFENDICGGLAVGSSAMTLTATVVSAVRPWFVPRTPIV